MPPTRAAARKTACGLASATQASTSAWRRRSSLATATRFLADRDQVGGHHLGDQGLEPDLMAPAQAVVRLGRIANQQVDLGRAKIAQIDRDSDRAGGGVYLRLVDPLA